LHIKDLPLSLKIQSFFGGIGKIYIAKDKQSAVLAIFSLKDLTNQIIPHFTKYPLITAPTKTCRLFIIQIDC
jgi:hypothetical protein